MPIHHIPEQSTPNYGLGKVPDSASVSNSSTQIVAQNLNRRWLLLVNVGARDVFFACGQTALINKGGLLEAKGGSISWGIDHGCVQIMNGITVAGTSEILILEGE